MTTDWMGVEVWLPPHFEGDGGGQLRRELFDLLHRHGFVEDWEADPCGATHPSGAAAQYYPMPPPAGVARPEKSGDEG